MSDVIDQAGEQEAVMTSTAVANARGRVPDPSEPGPEVCPECEDNAIPEGRRLMGYKLCVECAEDREAGRG